MGIYIRILVCVGAIFNTTGALAAQESGYFDLGLGYAAVSYSGNAGLQNYQSQAPRSFQLPIVIDAAYYWTIQNRMILGPMLEGVLDNYYSSDFSSDRIQLIVLGASYRYFFTEEVAGFFLRSDVGLSGAVTKYNNGTGSQGWSGLLGVGYALPSQSKAHFLFEVDYNYIGLSSGGVGAFLLKGSIMF